MVNKNRELIKGLYERYIGQVKNFLIHLEAIECSMYAQGVSKRHFVTNTKSLMIENFVYGRIRNVLLKSYLGLCLSKKKSVI